MARGLIALTASVADIDLSFVFPPVNLAITLVGTIVLALLVLLAPRAARGALQARRGAALCLTRSTAATRPRPRPGPRRRAPSARCAAAWPADRTPAGRAETLVFRLAMAAAALWVLDDAFWHREPGTSVGDHLASGLVPVALAALLALAYPRLRPGARAVAALTAGPLMIVAGVVDGVRHVAVDRLGGDDVTAILAGVAGAVLVVLGAAVLWRSRRLDERPLRRYLRRALVGAVAAFAASSSSCRSGSRSWPTTRRARRWSGWTSGGRTSTCR